MAIFTKYAHLFLRAGSCVCALPLDGVVETLRPLPLWPCTGAPDFVAGLSILRGRPTAVVDLGLILGGNPPAEPRRWVSLQLGERQLALAVDAVLDVRDLDPRTTSELPPLLGAAAEGRVRALGVLDAELLVVLESARLVPEAAWATLAQVAEASR